MAINFDDPGRIIEVIEALADPTRRKMLNLMYENRPNGLTASNLSDMIRKKIPTILHHLDKLAELDLVDYDMIKMTETGSREVKHWKVKHQKFSIEVDMDKIAFLPDNYIFCIFEEEKGSGGLITEDFGKNITEEEIKKRLLPKFPEISDHKIGIIKNHLQKKRDLISFLELWVYQEFLNSGRTLQVTFFEFGNHFTLNDVLRRKLFDKLIKSGNFFFYEGSTAEPRLVLTPEYYEANK